MKTAAVLLTCLFLAGFVAAATLTPTQTDPPVPADASPSTIGVRPCADNPEAPCRYKIVNATQTTSA